MTFRGDLKITTKNGGKLHYLWTLRLNTVRVSVLPRVAVKVLYQILMGCC